MTEQEKLKCLETCLQLELETLDSDLQVSVWKETDDYFIGWYNKNTNPKDGWIICTNSLWEEYRIEDLFKHTYFITLTERNDNFYRQTLSALKIKDYK